MKVLWLFAMFVVATELYEVQLTDGTLKATHYWDCSGGGCDADTLDPWNKSKYIYAGTYAPLDPQKYGGSMYGEKIWMTGAASDKLSQILGSRDSCCGGDKFGGCGKCLLVNNPTAVNKGWTALIMKKDRCPPDATGCQAGNSHLDFAVPGYDVLKYSLSNICGQNNTILSKAQSSVCGEWYKRGNSTIQGCSCASLPSGTAIQQIVKNGCELFTSWGWTTGNPVLNYKIVACPDAFRTIIHNAFNKNGPTNSTKMTETSQLMLQSQ